MTRAAIALSILFTFDPSPSADVASYRCDAWQIRMAEVSPAPPGCVVPCMRKTPPLALACDVAPSTVPGATFQASAHVTPSLGTVMFGRVVAIDGAGNESATHWVYEDPLLTPGAAPRVEVLLPW